MSRMNDVLEHFNICRATLYKWIEQGCPAHYVGKLVFFDLEEITAWVKEQNKQGVSKVL